MKPFSRSMLLRLVIEVFYNKCSSIFVYNWLILIRDTIMCKKKKTSKNKCKHSWMQYDCYNYAKYFMYEKRIFVHMCF